MFVNLLSRDGSIMKIAFYQNRFSSNLRTNELKNNYGTGSDSQ